MPFITSSRGSRIGFDIHGHGFPILFVPPPVIGKEVFHYQTEVLVDTFRIIRMDLPGHGGSSPSDVRLTYDHVVEDMHTLLHALQVPRAVICGYSMGGTIVLEFLRKHPEVGVGGILLSGFSEVRDAVLRAELAAGALTARTRATKALALALAMGNADCKSSFRRMWAAGRMAKSRDVADLFDQALHRHITEDIGGILSPICLVYGGDDKRFHKYGHVLQTHLPHAEFHIIPKVGHQLPTKAPGPLHFIIRAFASGCTFLD